MANYMQDETALIRKETPPEPDYNDDLEDGGMPLHVYIVAYPGSLFDVFKSKSEAENHALRFKGSRVIYRKVM